ncbi:glycosyltransferase [Arthrobacter sp. SLBN-112]|uniref:glycosyltransferase n=1 Tax=Arthrobacter sp. SLBN-112 TaxID=2768452 RepID=UPI001F2D8264|nr:glycosyltransferase [Arthrobacter sp. SLBN-112]
MPQAEDATVAAVHATSRNGGVRPRDLGLALAGAVSLVLAAGAASTVGVPVNSDLGLVAVLPYPYWVGLALLNITFVLALRGDARGPAGRPVMLWLLAVLVVELFGTAAFVTDIPRGEVAFRHLGIADALSSTKAVDPDIDAYFNWPGFFALLATVIKATGLEPVSIALWAPVFDVGLWLAALGVLTRSLTADPRRLWLVLWLFCLGNWQDQDYLSPQAFAFFLYLVVIALLVGPLAAHPGTFRGFRPAELAAWWRGKSPWEHRPQHRVGAFVVALLLVPVICASHQLTPFMMLIAMTALSLSGRVWTSRLPLITAVVLALWLVYPASAYLVGHPPLEDAGFQGAIAANVVDRVTGTPGHSLVVQVRMLLTLVLWALAAAGAVRDWHRKRLDIRVVLLAVTPLLLFPMQSYGGEMLIRVSLFALPFIALQASSVLLPRDGGTRLPFLAVMGLIPTFLLLSVLIETSRFGNTKFDIFTDSETAAVAEVERLAPHGAAIISAAHPTPWRSDAYLEHRYRTMDELCRRDLSAATCGPIFYNYARHNPAGAYVLLMRSTEASLELQGQSTQRNYAELEDWLKAQDGVELVFSNADARIYQLPTP